MLVVFQRAPIPNAAYWPGRRVLAALDAIAWPALWIAGAIVAPFRTGIAGALLISLALFLSMERLRKAIVENERYRFTTWRWGRPVGVFVAVGASLKLMLIFSGS